MDIVICDDQKNELENIKQVVSEYAKTHQQKRRSGYCIA